MDTTDAPQLIEHINHSVNYTPYETCWVPSSARLVVLGLKPKGNGVMEVFEMESGKFKQLSSRETPHGLKCGTFGASSLEDRHIAAGDFDGNVMLLDIETGLPVWKVTKGHSTLVNCVDGCGGLNIGCGAPEIVTGSRDGSVRVWDPRVDKAVVSLEPEGDPQDANDRRDCWSVAFGNSFNDEERVIAAGYDNGDVKLFDLRTNTIRWETNCANGICSVQFDRKDIEMNKLVVTTLESKFRVYDMRTEHPVQVSYSITDWFILKLF